MIVGISIDDVIRNFSDNFLNTLDKIYGGYQEVENIINPLTRAQETQFVTKYISDNQSLSRDTYSLLDYSSKYGIKTKKDLYHDLYDSYSFEFFATADMIDGNFKLPSTFNKFIIDLEEDYDEPIELVLIDRGVSRSITSTMFFLSKTGLYPRNIKFVKNYGDEWEHVDILFTANNETLMSKPEGKTSVKILTKYNSEIISDYVYNNLYEAINDFNNIKIKYV